MRTLSFMSRDKSERIMPNLQLQYRMFFILQGISPLCIEKRVLY